MSSLVHRLTHDSRANQVILVALAVAAVAGLVFDISPVVRAMLGVLAGAVWFLRLERRADRLGDRQAHLTTGLLALAAVGYMLWTGDSVRVITGSLVTLGTVSLGKAAWEQWSMADAFAESTHPFTPTASAENPVAGAVRTTLADGPRTRRELCETVDAEADAIDDALVDLRERGVVNQAGTKFRLTG